MADDRLILGVERDMEACEAVTRSKHEVVYYSHGWRDASCADRSNEDGFFILEVGPQQLVVAVADGLGGHDNGALASQTALQVLADTIQQSTDRGDADLRDAILSGFDAANRAVLDLRGNPATTLAVAEIDGRTLRSYHAGDSTILVTSQRSKLKLKTVDHSPVGYSVEAGLIDEVEAMYHEERHIVSNMVGYDGMHIDVGPPLKLAARDTVLLATDGLFDNLHADEIVALIRKGKLTKSTTELIDYCRKRMVDPTDDAEPSKPDDLTVIAVRQART